MLHKNPLIQAGLILLTPAWLASCSSISEIGTQKNNLQASADTGTLSLVANGEDFVRQGFVTKDGWQISFDHLYVTLTQVSAYNTKVPLDLDEVNKSKDATKVVLVSEPQTIDLALGDNNAEPILVTQVNAPAGNYHALSWQLVPAQEGETQGYTIVMDGVATKSNQKVDFVIKIDQPLDYMCGEFVGEERKGILLKGEQAEVETTFHFDHLFGDAQTASTDSINTDALGFEPIAALAQSGKLNVDTTALKAQLNSQQIQALDQAISSLGHVGEGHCQ